MFYVGDLENLIETGESSTTPAPDPSAAATSLDSSKGDKSVSMYCIMSNTALNFAATSGEGDSADKGKNKITECCKFYCCEMLK